MYDTIFAKGIASFRAGNHFKICPLDNFISPPLVSPSNLTLTSIHPFFILTLHELSRSTNYSITFYEEIYIYIYIYNFFLLPKIVAFISKEDKDEEEKCLVSFSRSRPLNRFLLSRSLVIPPLRIAFTKLSNIFHRRVAAG